MWTRAELKRRAKQTLRRYYGPAILVSFIAKLFSSNGSGGSAAGWNAGSGIKANLGAGLALEEFDQLEGLLEGLPGNLTQIKDALTNPMALGVIASALVITAVLSFVFNVFVKPLLIVGKNRYYMESRQIGRSAGVHKVFWGFTHSYLNIVWISFLKNVIIFLGTCCFVIPGLYFSYSLHMVPYILAENPDMRAGNVFSMSHDMMEGHKMRAFVLSLSFIGWWILGALMCGMGAILIQPYYDATFAELYATLRTPYERYLSGFGREEHRYSYQQTAYREGGYAYDEQQQFTKRDENAGTGEEPTAQRDAEGSRNTDYGYHQRTEGNVWNERETVAHEASEVDTKVHGYYLNGVFYPYTEEELRQLEENKHKN